MLLNKAEQRVNYDDYNYRWILLGMRTVLLLQMLVLRCSARAYFSMFIRQLMVRVESMYLCMFERIYACIVMQYEHDNICCMHVYVCMHVRIIIAMPVFAANKIKDAAHNNDKDSFQTHVALAPSLMTSSLCYFQHFSTHLFVLQVFRVLPDQQF